MTAIPQNMSYQLPAAQPLPTAQSQFQPIYVNSAAQLPQGAMPLTQDQVAQLMQSNQAPAIMQATLAAQAIQAPPSTGRTVLSSILKGAGVGAALGAVVGILPFPPGVLVGTLIGAGAGAVIGGVAGIVRSRSDRRRYAALAQQAQATQPAPPAQAAPIGTPPADRPKVHLNEATKAKLKVKNDALKAAAAKARAEAK